MADFLDALRDPQFRADYLQGLKDAGNRSAAAFFGGPVDMATMVARPFGYDVPDRDVVGSSEWIGRKMEERGMVSEARNPVAEFLAALALPGGMAAAGTKLYAGEQALSRAGQQMAQNAMVPSTLNRQAGVIKIQHSPEQMDIWAKQKAERDSKNILEAEKSRLQKNRLSERFKEGLSEYGIGKTFTDDQLQAINFYADSGDRTGALTEAKSQAVQSVKKALQNLSVPIEKISEKGGGTSVYANVNGKVIRISDHELPMTPERMHNRSLGLSGKWDKEFVLDDWRGLEMDSLLSEILKQ